MNRGKSIVYTPQKIGKIEIKNRLVKSATYENAAAMNGDVTDSLLDMYSRLSKGGVGMIITGLALVYSKNIGVHRALRIYDDRYMTGLKRLTRSVHAADKDCKLILQLFHPGRQIATAESGVNLVPYFSPALMEYMGKHPEILAQEQSDDAPAEPTAPSAVLDKLLKQTPRALTVEEIEEIVSCFAEGIQKAQEVGFDGVQLHAAHGWLLSSFLSPHTNKREDRYGGSLENRSRIIEEIYEEGRKRVGEDFPILIKMNTTDFFPDGTTVSDSVKMATILSRLGFNAIEASGGMWESLILGEEKLGWKPYLIPEARLGIDSKAKEAYFLEGAREIRRQIESPVIVVGGIRSFSKVEEILGRGEADFVSMARPLIRQPDLPNIWLSGGPDRAKCISCNACFPAGNQPISCHAEK